MPRCRGCRRGKECIWFPYCGPLAVPEHTHHFMHLMVIPFSLEKWYYLFCSRLSWNEFQEVELCFLKILFLFAPHPTPNRRKWLCYWQTGQPIRTLSSWVRRGDFDCYKANQFALSAASACLGNRVSQKSYEVWFHCRNFSLEWLFHLWTQPSRYILGLASGPEPGGLAQEGLLYDAQSGHSSHFYIKELHVETCFHILICPWSISVINLLLSLSVSKDREQNFFCYEQFYQFTNCQTFKASIYEYVSNVWVGLSLSTVDLYFYHFAIYYSFDQVLMVRFASLFDAKERTVTFLSGKKYSLNDLRSMGAGDLLNSMFEFSEKLNALNLSDEEMSLFTAVVLVSAGKRTILIYIYAKQ